MRRAGSTRDRDGIVFPPSLRGGDGGRCRGTVRMSPPLRPLPARGGEWIEVRFARSAPHVNFELWNGPTRALCSGCGRHGESSAIVELLTREHGRHLGLVRRGAPVRECGRCYSPVTASAQVWRGAARRTSRHFRDRRHAIACGDFAGILLCGLWGDPSGVTGGGLLPERDPHQDIYDTGRAHSRRFSMMQTLPRCIW